MTEDANVILLYGNDEYAMARRLKEFESMFADASNADMNTARLDARTMSANDLHNAVMSLPFLADHRLVLLANPSRRYVGRKTLTRVLAQAESPAADPTLAQDQDQAEVETGADDQGPADVPTEAKGKFLELLAGVPPTTRLVISEVIELRTKRDRETAEKHWLVKWIRKAGLGLERYALPSPTDMIGWIARQVKKEGGQIGSQAGERLSEMVGADPRQAAQEVTKLLTYVNWSRPITMADVEAVSSYTSEPDVFAMVDALATGQGGPAQRLLHRLLESQDVFSTWGMIIRQFRLLLIAREVIENRGGKRDVERALGVHPFVAGKAFDQAQRFTLPGLENIYHRLLEIDEAAKTGKMSLDVGMELLVVELAG
jgi:DNA polymerase-3 subunit delta